MGSRTAVGRYAFINAKLRARLSGILTESFTEKMLRASSVEEAVFVLGEEGFRELSDVYDRTADIQAVESAMFNRKAVLYSETARKTEGSVRSFAEAMSIRIEIGNLKNVLRLWYGSTIRKRPIGYRAEYIHRKRILYEIDWERMVNASGFEELLVSTEQTPYHAILSRYRNDITEGRGLFGFETALDKFYYSFLSEKASNLPSRDRDIVKNILSAEIDLQNIGWLIRYSHFYRLEPEELSKIIIPGGHGVNEDRLRAFIESEHKKENPADLLKHVYPSLASAPVSDKDNFSMHAVMLERALDDTRRREFMKLITGYPFTIGIIMVYFFMLDREEQFISSVLNGKLYGWDRDRIGEYSS